MSLLIIDKYTTKTVVRVSFNFLLNRISFPESKKEENLTYSINSQGQDVKKNGLLRYLCKGKRKE